MREKLPDRRACWTQKVRIDGVSYYLTCGEYPDGRLAEIWICAHKHGSFSRGVLDTMARNISISIQCGTPVEEVVKSLRALDFPPQGDVRGSPFVEKASSLPEWIAQEIEAVYLKQVNGVEV